MNVVILFYSGVCVCKLRDYSLKCNSQRGHSVSFELQVHLNYLKLFNLVCTLYFTPTGGYTLGSVHLSVRQSIWFYLCVI